MIASIPRKMGVTIWGEAAANATVGLTLGDVQVSITTDTEGNWTAEIPAQSHGGPYVLSIVSGDTSVEIQNVLIGEVWLASGQSNMAWAMRRSPGADLDIALSANPMIRFSKGSGWTWANNPAVNLYSTNELPVTPFRTDDWQEITIAGQEE